MLTAVSTKQTNKLTNTSKPHILQRANVCQLPTPWRQEVLRFLVRVRCLEDLLVKGGANTGAQHSLQVRQVVHTEGGGASPKDVLDD